MGFLVSTYSTYNGSSRMAGRTSPDETLATTWAPKIHAHASHTIQDTIYYHVDLSHLPQS